MLKVYPVIMNRMKMNNLKLTNVKYGILLLTLCSVYERQFSFYPVSEISTIIAPICGRI